MMRACGLIATSLLLMMGCWGKPTPSSLPSTTTANIQFEDVLHPWNSDIIYRNGQDAGLLAILESLGGGVGVLDYDGDAVPDLLFPGGGRLTGGTVTGLPSRLMRGDGKQHIDASEHAGIHVERHYSHGCTVGDYNNDGFPDALITGYGGLTLWMNQGDGTFHEATKTAGLDDTSWSSSAGWGDLNSDGNPDLYVAHYVNWSPENHPPCYSSGQKADVCPPRQFDPLDHIVYFGTGDGGFTNATMTAGLVAGGKGLGVLLLDADHDADLDVYVANDTTENFLYLNDGRGNLQEQGVLSGVALDDQANANGSMGVAVTDYNNDGHADIWVTNYEDEVFALYHGAEAATFTHVSGNVGVRLFGQLFVGFGCVAVDFDLDGYEDFATANGHVINVPRNAPIQQEPLILHNRRGETFARVPMPTGYFSKTWMGRGLASLDFDGDGRIDLVFVNSEQPAALVRNSTQADGRALQFQLVGRHSSRDATGAEIRLIVSDAKARYTRWVYGGGSYLSSSSPIVHFGLPSETVVNGVEVTWPGGKKTSWSAGQFGNKLKDHRVNILVEPASDAANAVPAVVTLPSR